MNRLLRRAIAAIIAAAPCAAYGQTVPGGPGTPGMLVLPNAGGTIVYRGTGATTTRSGGVTVFHGTGPTATVTIEGNVVRQNR